MCGNNNSDSVIYEPLERDWKGYLEQHPMAKLDYNSLKEKKNYALYSLD